MWHSTQPASNDSPNPSRRGRLPFPPSALLSSEAAAGQPVWLPRGAAEGLSTLLSCRQRLFWRGAFTGSCQRLFAFLALSSLRWASTGRGLRPSPGRTSAGCGGFKRRATVAGHRFWPWRRYLVSFAVDIGMGSLCGDAVRSDLLLDGLDLASWCGGCRRHKVWVGVIGHQFPLPIHRVSAASMV
jgi:hypothetical protein